MTRHDDTVSLRQMLDHALEAVALCRGKSGSDLPADRTLTLALTRLLEIIGEAASRVSPPLREKYPEIRWRAAIGMRNVLIHAYDQIDFDVLWRTVTEDLPSLIEDLERALGKADT